MKKIISIILAILCLICGTLTVFAASDEVIPRYTNISAIRYAFDVNTNTGISTVNSSFTIYNGYFGEITATIQRKNGSNWDDVKTFTIKESSDSVELYRNWAVASNNIYRCEFVFKVYNSREILLESVTKYSPIVLFPGS